MKTGMGLAAISLVAASCVFRPVVAEAAEVKLLCAVAMKSVLDDLRRHSNVQQATGQ
jgi:hypothetical protein